MSEERLPDVTIKSAAEIFFTAYSAPFKTVAFGNRWFVVDYAGKVVTQIFYGMDGHSIAYPNNEPEIAEMIARGLNVLTKMSAL